MLDQAKCEHPVKGLREAPTFPEKYVKCSDCGALLLLEPLIGRLHQGWEARFRGLILALAGASTDTRSLRQFMAPEMGIQEVWPWWPDGKEKTEPQPMRVVPGSQEDPEPQAFRRAS